VNICVKGNFEGLPKFSRVLSEYPQGISMPPFEKGLQRSILQIALKKPLKGPYFFIARIAYSEQVG